MNTIRTQIKNLAEIFDLDPRPARAFAMELPDIPDGAEAWVARPAIEALQRNYFPQINDPDKMHCRGIELVLSKIQEHRELHNQFHSRLERVIKPNQLRIHSRTVPFLDQIAQAQKGDIQIIAVQLGRLYCEESVSDARLSFFENEFGLDSITVGSVILTHPRRFINMDDRYVFCAGEECCGEHIEFKNCPSFDQFLSRSGGGISCISYGYGGIHYKSSFYGAASGFVPELRATKGKRVRSWKIPIPMRTQPVFA